MDLCAQGGFQTVLSMVNRLHAKWKVECRDVLSALRLGQASGVDVREVGLLL